MLLGRGVGGRVKYLDSIKSMTHRFVLEDQTIINEACLTLLSLSTGDFWKSTNWFLKAPALLKVHSLDPGLDIRLWKFRESFFNTDENLIFRQVFTCHIVTS